MTQLWNPRSWKTALLLSVMVPMTLVATFRLTGILQEPLAVSETVTLDAVRWNMERPYFGFVVGDRIQGYSGSDISLDDEVVVYKFGTEEPSPDLDTADLFVNVSAFLQSGFVVAVNITFLEDCENSQIQLFSMSDRPSFYSVAGSVYVGHYADHLAGRGMKAFVEYGGANQARNISISNRVSWWLPRSGNETHMLDVGVEVTYYNGTAYKKIVQPFQLKFAPDNNDSFDTAQEIHMGFYPRLLIGSSLGGDLEDFYKIYLTQGQKINVKIYPGEIAPMFNMYIYDPNREVAFSDGPEGHVDRENVTLVVNSTGFWFIEIHGSGSCGSYSLEVSQ